MLSASSASSASDATSASLPTAAEITSTVVSAMYRVSDWAVSAVGDRLRSTASPSASSLPEQSCASSVALYDALTGEVVTEFKPHGDNGA